MYSVVAQELNSFQADRSEGQYPLCMPEFIYGECTEDAYNLVMLDINYLDYFTRQKTEGLDLIRLKLAVTQLARLHAISYAYDERHNFLQNFPQFKYSTDTSTLLKNIVYVSLENCIDFLESRSYKSYNEMAHKLKVGKSKLPAKLAHLCDDQTQHKLLCLTHGDFWSGNLLFKSEIRGRKKIPTSIMVIDWQLTQWNNPVFDVHYLLSTSTTYVTRKNHTEEILKHYHDTFTEIIRAMGTQIPNWKYKHFKQEYERTSLLGFLCGVCLIQGTLSKAEEKFSPKRPVSSNNAWLRPFQRLKDWFISVYAKIAVPLAFNPFSSCIMHFSMKKRLHAIGKELVEGNNEVMNKRLLDFLHEADDKGIIDAMST